MPPWRHVRRAVNGLFLAGLLLSGTPAWADEITFQPPRAFGYVLGDTLTLAAEVRLDPGARLDPASLPQPHKVSSWLELVAVEITPAIGAVPAGPYRLRLTYQTFFSALEPRSLEIPAWPLTIIRADGPRTLSVPAFRFVVSPLRELTPSKGGNPLALQPDMAPTPFALRPDLMKAALAALVAVAGAGGLALTQGWRPFARRPRPFAAAARAIRRAGAQDEEGRYLAALVTLHRAFDEAAGHRLLADDLADFLRQAPGLSCERVGIERLFAASRMAFFGAGAPGAMAELPPDALITLATRLARAERRAPTAAPQEVHP